MVQNGSFEAPAQNAQGFYKGVVPTDWNNNGGVIYLINGTPANSPGPEDGSQFVELFDRDAITQNINVPEAGRYILSVWAAGAGRAQAGYMNVNITNTGDKSISDKISSKDWNDYSAIVSLAAGANQIYIQEAANSRLIFVDNVSLVMIPNSAPDSGSALRMFSVVLGSLAVCARKWRIDKKLRVRRS